MIQQSNINYLKMVKEIYDKRIRKNVPIVPLTNQKNNKIMYEISLKILKLILPRQEEMPQKSKNKNIKDGNFLAAKILSVNKWLNQGINA